MNEEQKQQVLDKLTKVCTCRSISRSRIKESIANGALTLDEVIKDTGACLGSCKGRCCKFKINELIEKSKLNGRELYGESSL